MHGKHNPTRIVTSPARSLKQNDEYHTKLVKPRPIPSAITILDEDEKIVVSTQGMTPYLHYAGHYDFYDKDCWYKYSKTKKVYNIKIIEDDRGPYKPYKEWGRKKESTHTT